MIKQKKQIDFVEMSRALGYPKLVSMESFRQPNFPLVSDLLIWLAKRFETDVDMPFEIEHEEERVALIRNAAQFMVRKKKAPTVSKDFCVP